jgi:hypothetical protein
LIDVSKCFLTCYQQNIHANVANPSRFVKCFLPTWKYAVGSPEFLHRVQTNNPSVRKQLLPALWYWHQQMVGIFCSLVWKENIIFVNIYESYIYTHTVWPSFLSKRIGLYVNVTPIMFWPELNRFWYATFVIINIRQNNKWNVSKNCL